MRVLVTICAQSILDRDLRTSEYINLDRLVSQAYAIENTLSQDHKAFYVPDAARYLDLRKRVFHTVPLTIHRTRYRFQGKQRRCGVVAQPRVRQSRQSRLGARARGIGKVEKWSIAS